MRSLMIAALALVGTTLVTVGTARADDCAPYGRGSTITTYDAYGRPVMAPQPVYVPPPPVVAPVVYGRAPYYGSYWRPAYRPVVRPIRVAFPAPHWGWHRR